MLILTRHWPASSQSMETGQNPAAGELRLDYDQRLKRRARFVISQGALAGQPVGIDLPRGQILRDGDWLMDEAGQHTVVVRAAVQQLLQVRSADWLLMSRIAYHLGNRHVPLALLKEDGQAVLRLQLDHVLEQMVHGLGASTEVVSTAFDPENGAYHSHGAGHHHHADQDLPADPDAVQFDRRHSPIIHDFLDPNAAPVKR